ncbi:MAG: hypothetical protein LV481_04925 [Methylacidiphilales bacterium]|nr:hypothetical protein [Candidatus Methylacidiphilales bacterium]
MKSFPLIILVLVGLIGVIFYYLKAQVLIISVSPNEISKIEFEDSVLGKIAPPITDRNVIEKWTQDLHESKFTKNPHYNWSVILGRVYFEGTDGVPEASMCANIEQSLLADDPEINSYGVYTANHSPLYNDIVDYIKTENADYYNHQMKLLERLRATQGDHVHE